MDGLVTATALRRPAAGALSFTLRAAREHDPERTLRLILPLSCDPLAPLEQADDVSMIWRSGELELLGLGVAYQLTAVGTGRFDEIRSGAETIFSSIDTVCGPNAEGSCGLAERRRPRFFGGFSFASGSARAGAWSAFGDATFVLPQFVLARDQEGAGWLELTLPPSDRREERLAAIGTRLEAILGLAPEGLADASAQEMPAQSATPPTSQASDHDEWCSRIEDIRAAIEAGDVKKVVAAREVLFPVCADVPQLIRGLREGMPDCLLFGLVCDQTTFLGASPERLVARSGTRIRSHALAGSIRPGAEGTGEQAAVLFDSEKDRWEHRLVVDHLVARLRPWCRELSWPDEPKVQKLRNVLHLESPVVGELGDERHVLDLVAELHPTPAVGGVPPNRAEDWIIENEPAPRGWYSGPIGWFDESGDGDFAVAIRSGLVSQNDVRLYSGAGIVADSRPHSEYEETELKLTPLRVLLERQPQADD